MSPTAERARPAPEIAGSSVRGPHRLRGTHARVLVVVVLAVTFALVVGLGLRWWTHPDVFTTGGGTQVDAAEALPVERAQQTYGVVLPPGARSSGPCPGPVRRPARGPRLLPGR